jgi:hypothetical protein
MKRGGRTAGNEPNTFPNVDCYCNAILFFPLTSIFILNGCSNIAFMFVLKYTYCRHYGKQLKSVVEPKGTG